MMRHVIGTGLAAVMLAVVSQAVVADVQFTFEDPDGWVASGDQDFPYEWEYTLEITDMGQTEYLNDYEILLPKINPGYLHVIPPPDWSIEDFYLGRLGFQSNNNIENEVTIGGWVFKGKFPEVEYGSITVTSDGGVVGTGSAWIPSPEPATLALVGLGAAALAARRRRR